MLSQPDLEGTCYSFCHVLLVTQTNPGQCGVRWFLGADTRGVGLLGFHLRGCLGPSLASSG